MTNPRDVTALPAGVASLSELAGEWVIARVRGGFERRLALLLTISAPGIGYCLPMETVQKYVGGQKRGTYTRLIFPSYLFVCCRHEDDRYELVARDGVLQQITVKDQERFVHEVSGFQIAAENGLLRRERCEIRKGIECEIVRGALAGHRGWIDKVTEDRRRVVIAVTILGDSRPTNIPIDDVEPVD